MPVSRLKARAFIGNPRGGGRFGIENTLKATVVDGPRFRSGTAGARGDAAGDINGGL
jgi:hypothetical protein